MLVALLALLTLGPEIVPSTPAKQPAMPIGPAIAPDRGFVVAYSSPSGLALAELDASGVPLHEHATVLPADIAFPGGGAGELISYATAEGVGVVRVDGMRAIVARGSYPITSLTYNGREYLVAWNERGTLSGLLLDRSGTPIGAPFTIATVAESQFTLAATSDGFLVATVTVGFCGSRDCLIAIPVSEQGAVGTSKLLAGADAVILQRQALVGTSSGYLLCWAKNCVALDRDGNIRATTQIINDTATFLAATASGGGAMALTDHGVLLSIDANAEITNLTTVAPMTNVMLTATDRSLLIVASNGASVLDKRTSGETPRRPIAMNPVPQSAPLLAVADDGTILASWQVAYAQPRLGRVRGNVPIDGDGIALDASSIAIGTNGRDFLVATGGSSLSIAFLGATGPIGAPHVIDINTDHADSIIWNGRNYIVFFTRVIADPNTGTCGTWREQIYAAIVNDDLTSATLQPIALTPASQRNALAAKTRDGITLAYSPAHAISEVGGFTVHCRDTMDVAVATLDDDLHVLSEKVLSERGPRDDETPLNVVTDGTNTIVSWLLVIDPHNNGTRVVYDNEFVFDGSRLVRIDPFSLPADTFVAARGAIAYIRSSQPLGIGDSFVMVVRSVNGAPPRQRPSR